MEGRGAKVHVVINKNYLSIHAYSIRNLAQGLGLILCLCYVP